MNLYHQQFRTARPMNVVNRSGTNKTIGPNSYNQVLPSSNLASGRQRHARLTSPLVIDSAGSRTTSNCDVRRVDGRIHSSQKLRRRLVRLFIQAAVSVAAGHPSAIQCYRPPGDHRCRETAHQINRPAWYISVRAVSVTERCRNVGKCHVIIGDTTVFREKLHFT